MLNSAEHEIFSANKYEKKKLLAFSYLLAAIFSFSAMFSKKTIAILLVLRDLFVGQISCLAELSRKKSYITLGPCLFVQILRVNTVLPSFFVYLHLDQSGSIWDSCNLR